MKMMCIAGRQHPAHTGLVAGQVYEVTITRICCRDVAMAEGSKWRWAEIVGVKCRRCKAKTRVKLVPWGPWRFVPWTPEVVKELEKDNEALFKSDKEKQDA